MDTYPRQVSNYGATRFPFFLGVISKLTTCGTLVFVSDAGEHYIYLDGTDPVTPMFGGVNEIMTNPGGGVALGTAVAKAPIPAEGDLRGKDNSAFGSVRLSSSAAVCDSKRPALGLMWNRGQSLAYLFVVGLTGELRLGTEADLLATVPGGVVLATKLPSGALGVRRDGRAVIGGNSRVGPSLGAASVTSGGRGAALVLASGDHAVGVAFYTADGAALTISNFTNWLTWVNT